MTNLKLNLTDETVRFAIIDSEGIAELPVEESSENVQINGIGILLDECLQLMLNYKTYPYIFVDQFINEKDNVSDLNTTEVGYYPFSALNQSSFNTSRTFIHLTLESVSSLFQNDLADVALGYYFLLAPRLQISNALLPLADEKFNLYFRQPKFTQFDNPFNRQFSPDLAFTYLAIMFASGVLLASYATVTSNNFSLNISNLWKFFQDSVIWAVGTWCQQAPGFATSETWQVKFVMNLLSQLSSLLYSMYCAVIIATLTRNLVPIRKMEHLFQYKYSLYAFGETRDRLLSDNELKLVWHPPTVPPNMEDNIEEYERNLSLARLGTERHAHLDTADVFLPELDKVLSSNFGGTNSSASKKICEKLSALPVRGGGLQSGFYVRKGFPFRNEFNYALSRIRETGINNRLIDTYDKIRFQKIGCQNTMRRQTYQDNLGMTYLGSMFTTLGWAYFVTIIVVFVEWLCLRKFAILNFAEKIVSIVKMPK